MNPVISVITINRNNCQGLRQTIQSVLSQTFTNYEYIIIDGDSTDGSVAEIKLHESKLSYWNSEPDTGVYNAQNKGIAQATGDYLIFLNSGDVFCNENVLFELIHNSNNEAIVFGNIVFKTGEGSLKPFQYPDHLTFEFFLKDTLPHPCTLIKKELFKKYGSYKEYIKICADWAFFIDCIVKHNVTYLHIDLPIATFLLGGLSSENENSVVKVKSEKMAYLFKFYPFLMEQYEELNGYKSRLIHLQNSRQLKYFSLFSKKIKRILYLNGNV